MIQLSLDFGECSSAPPVAVIDKDERRREKKRAKYRRWYAKNRERKLACDRKWRAENPERVAANKRKWRAENHEKERARYRRRYAENPEGKLASIRKWRAANPEWKKANNNKWAAENPEKQRAAERKYREKNRTDPEFVAARREWERAWAKANPGKVSAKRIQRQFRQEQRTPSWADVDEINTVYLACPDGMTVDHIVPLLGKTVEGYRVNGLHVPWNLSYMTQSENSGKSNRMRPEDGITAPLPV